MRKPASSALRGIAQATLAVLAIVCTVPAAVGWLYALRGVGWFALGPHVSDALPLLQLARTDGQPLLRVGVAWVLTGVVAGAALRRIPRLPRVAISGGACLVLLLLVSQASYGLARNYRFSQIVFSRTPGNGPWVEAILFAAGCGLLACSARGTNGRSSRLAPLADSVLLRSPLAGHPRVSRGKSRHAP